MVHNITLIFLFLIAEINRVIRASGMTTQNDCGKLSHFKMVLWIGAILLCLFKFHFRGLEWLQNPYLWSMCATGMIAVCLWKCRVTSWNVCWLCFIVWCAVGICLGNPNPAFQSWQRLVYLGLGLALLSPIIENRRLDMLRQRIWWCVCALVAVSCMISFVICLINTVKNGSWTVSPGVFPGGLGLSHFSAIAAIMGINIIMQNRFKLWIELIIYGYIGVCVVLLFEGGSRMGVLSLLIAVMMLSMYYRNKATAKFLMAIGGVTIVFCIYPEWWYDFAHIIYRKFNSGVTHGSLTWSRDSLWAARWQEFMESPFYGVGLGAVRYFAYPWNNPEEILSHGHIEPGSSWLGVLSQTGIVGFILLVIPVIGIVIRAIMILATERNCPDTAIKNDSSLNRILLSVDSLQLQMSVFLILFIQSFTEGYLLSAGSFHFMMFWLVLSRLDKFEDSAYSVKIRVF